MYENFVVFLSYIINSKILHLHIKLYFNYRQILHIDFENFLHTNLSKNKNDSYFSI